MKSYKFKKIKLSDNTLYDDLKAYVREMPDKDFLFTEDASRTLEETFQRVRFLMCLFSGKGIKKGDIAAIRMSRTPEALLLFFALQSLGALTVLCDSHSTVNDFIESAEINISPLWFITDEEGGWALKDKTFNDVCALDLWADTAFSEAEADALAAKVDVRDGAVIIFTSGSTGKIKAVIQSQFAYLNATRISREGFACDNGGAFLVVVPLYHMVFLTAALGTALVLKQSMVFPKHTSAEYVMESIERFKITTLVAAPTLYLNMTQSDSRKRYDLSSMVCGHTSAGPYTSEQFKQIEKVLGFRISGSYGTTEFCAVTITAGIAPIEVRSRGVGCVYPNIECFILDGDGKNVPAGEEGEICARGFPLMKGYYGDKEATREVIDENGIFHTGDIGRFDKDGILYITGRIKNLIIRGGKNISPEKIETALLSLSYIHQAAAVGIKDEIYGEVPAVMAILKPGEKADEKQIKRDLESKLIKPEMPVKIVVVERLPLLSAGKVDKAKIKNILSLWPTA